MNKNIATSTSEPTTNTVNTELQEISWDDLAKLVGGQGRGGGYMRIDRGGNAHAPVGQI